MADSSLLIGRLISHYRIVEKLGAGGMGEVYRAHDEQVNRDVAFKILPPHPEGGAEAAKKLLREARSASALNDPHICVVHEVGEAEGQPFIVMELVDGRPLSSLIPAKGLRPELVVRYGMQITGALIRNESLDIDHRLDFSTCTTQRRPQQHLLEPRRVVQGGVESTAGQTVTKVWNLRCQARESVPATQNTPPGTRLLGEEGGWSICFTNSTFGVP